MLKRLLLGWFLTLAALSWGQGALYSDSVSNQYGKPVPYAQVRICSTGATGQPCSPLALLYTDETMGTALSNPVYADKNGNYRFYAPPGFYVRQILINNVVRDEQKIMVGVSKEYVDAHAGVPTGGEGGSTVAINGVGVTGVNLNSTTPPAQAGHVQAKVQESSGSVSIEIPVGTTSTTAAAGNHNHSGVYEPANADIVPHLTRTDNPHSTTKAQVGLGNVDNTSDANKPISTATQTALNAKAASDASTTVNGQTCALGGSCTITVGGVGTVTHTAGALTSGAVMVGNGAADSKTTGVTIDGSDAMTIPGGVGIGAGQPTVINVKSQAISTLPSSNNTTGDHRQVSDGTNATDCTSGGGTNVHWCYWNGSAWVSEVASLSVAGSSGDLQTNNGSSGMGAVPQSTFATAGHAHTGMATVIAKGQVALSTGAIASGACATTITATATGADPASPNYDRIVTTLIADPSGVTGYGATTGSLTVYFWITANTVNLKQCNWTSGSITPGAASVNWAVVR